MLSTQLQHVSEGFDELIDQSQSDFQSSGLKIASVVRIARIAVVSANLLVGTIDEVSLDRLKGTSKNSYFVAPAKAGVQSNQQAGFPPSRE